MINSAQFTNIKPSRRVFLERCAGLAALTISSSLYGYEEQIGREIFYSGDRELWIVRDGRETRVKFYKDDRYIPNAYEELCFALKDKRQDIAIRMDVQIFDILSFSQKWLALNNINRPIIITSGYRTPYTNASIEGSARDSMHKYGKAIDGKVQGIDPLYFGKVARQVGAGGVGIYQAHTHLDTWMERVWRG